MNAKKSHPYLLGLEYTDLGDLWSTPSLPLFQGPHLPELVEIVRVRFLSLVDLLKIYSFATPPHKKNHLRNKTKTVNVKSMRFPNL